MSVIKPEMTCHMQFKIVCLIENTSKDVHLRLKIFLTIESTNLITLRKIKRQLSNKMRSLKIFQVNILHSLNITGEQK